MNLPTIHVFSRLDTRIPFCLVSPSQLGIYFGFGAFVSPRSNFNLCLYTTCLCKPHVVVIVGQQLCYHGCMYVRVALHRIETRPSTKYILTNTCPDSSIFSCLAVGASWVSGNSRSFPRVGEHSPVKVLQCYAGRLVGCCVLGGFLRFSADYENRRCG